MSTDNKDPIFVPMLYECVCSEHVLGSNASVSLALVRYFSIFRCGISFTAMNGKNTSDMSD